MRNPKTVDETALDRIKIVCEPFDNVVEFTLIGTPDDLLAAGVVEPGMTDAGRAGKPRVDSFGDTFKRRTLTAGRVEMTRKISDTARARLMPGCAEDLMTPILSLLHATPDKFRSIAADREGYCEFGGTDRVLIRAGLALPEMFTHSFDKPFHKVHDWSGSHGVIIARLRDGFYIVEWRKDRCPLLVGKRPRPSAMRLVWSNPAMEVSHG